MLRLVIPCPFVSELDNTSVERVIAIAFIRLCKGFYYRKGGNNMQQHKVVFTTRTMTYMALFAALQIVLEWLTKFTPSMPQGGNIAFSLVAIFLCSYIMGWGYGVILGIVCTGLHFALGMALFYGPLSVIFDYVLPMIIVGLAGIIPLLKIGKGEFPLGIVIAIILKTISHLISGWYAFNTPLVANLAYNTPYNLATMIACIVLFMLLYPRLKGLYRK